MFSYYSKVMFKLSISWQQKQVHHLGYWCCLPRLTRFL